LIVFDNCEHLIGGCAKTAEAILRRCPQVHLVATSREPLGIGGETIYRVPALSLPGPGDAGTLVPGSSDAVALFAERAKEQGVTVPVDEETGPLVVSICRRLDGLPLAIELAAARLRSLSLGALHDRLDQRFRLLTGGSRTALERQQTLEATVGWSYSLLSGAEQLLLRRLSVFAEASIWRPPKRCAASVTSRRLRSLACSARWWTRASSWQSPPAGPSGTGCWRPSASSPPTGSPGPARTKPLP
jgi:predicted ATPase